MLITLYPILASLLVDGIVRIMKILGLLLVNHLFAAMSYEDFSTSTESMGENGCITTVDFLMTEELAQEEDLLIDYPNPTIRQQGMTIQLFYSNAGFGKSQWAPMSSYSGVYIMGSSILLPIGQWISNGMQEGWWIRLVIVDAKQCETSDRNYSSK